MIFHEKSEKFRFFGGVWDNGLYGQLSQTYQVLTRSKLDRSGIMARSRNLANSLGYFKVRFWRTFLQLLGPGAGKEGSCF